ncbi:MAG: hypothetical protein IJI41_07450 [Anaerolineaceae bacterium]|nr:hypothetical protein [Anaerolineaceae bacterium]
MKKILLSLCLAGLLAGCVTTPETVSIESTVEAAVNSAVSTAMAPYETRYSEFITSAQLETSQNDQNKQIQNMVMDQMELYKAEVFSNIQPTDIPVAPTVTTVEYVDNKVVPTDSPRTYKNDPTCVDRFTYVSDITVPDGMVITPKTNFTKSWYITNSGTCTWNSKYKLVYTSGDQIGMSKSFDILAPNHFIQPGESLVVSANLSAPDHYQINNTFTSYWAIESDRGEVFGAGDAKNVYLSSSFTVGATFNAAQNFSSLTCMDDSGYITCGSSTRVNGRGIVYYDGTPTLESSRSGYPAIVVGPPVGRDNSKARFEFGPLRMPRGSYFYTNFCCRPDTPHCDVTVRLYTKEPGYDWVLRQEKREWNDGWMSEWKLMLDEIGVFDQDFYYALEVETNGGSTEEDLIMFTNLRLY